MHLQVYQLEELQMIANLCLKHDLLCFSDEVYEWLTYDGAKHVKIGESHSAGCTCEPAGADFTDRRCVIGSQPSWDVGTDRNSRQRREDL